MLRTAGMHLAMRLLGVLIAALGASGCASGADVASAGGAFGFVSPGGVPTSSTIRPNSAAVLAR